MYYPFFRGKQYELVLLREQAPFIAEHDFRPIIEPVKFNFKPLGKTIEHLMQSNAGFVIVANPKCGDMAEDCRLVSTFVHQIILGYPRATIGYIVRTQSDVDSLKNDIADSDGCQYSVIHYGHNDGKTLSETLAAFSAIKEHIFMEKFAGTLYRRHFKEPDVKRILVRDGFQIRKNSAHPPTEHFSELHMTYKEYIMDGFGDFLIVGDDYSEAGGPAYAVAIHITYLDGEQDMYVRHFVSDSQNSPTNPAGKFDEAVGKLEIEVNSGHSSILRTSACQEYLRLYETHHFPGLGYVKKLSMQHHLELMGSVLE